MASYAIFIKRDSQLTVNYREILIVIYLIGFSQTSYAARMEIASERVLSQEIP